MAKFTQLNQIGNLSFSSFRGTSFIKNKTNKKPVKSSIYGIIREIILMEEYDDVSVDFGCLELEMGLVEENEFDNEREVIANALNILYSINQEMHRKTPAHLRRE
ncbi:hypothetical protein [Moraxella equi]|uniref:Uncharacterized protein n=1 Tax=Moraxella equi TaxID=60442 RepID=A0A378QT23_9GAMM|nr:hypothetical protein [Moraxella equi]OPH36798.1 hypothetical protein B5J93_08965 [Moraxella equi]STZ04056.1 Uncharacterised protein [Moraxella equi]